MRDPLRLAMQEFRDDLYGTVPSEAMAQKGHASYPGDFSHLRPGKNFAAWRVGDGWEIETTLDSTALMERLEKFRMEEN